MREYLGTLFTREGRMDLEVDRWVGAFCRAVDAESLCCGVALSFSEATFQPSVVAVTFWGKDKCLK